MSDAAPPVWIRRLPKAHAGLDAAHKFMLITLWAWALYAVKRGSKCDRPDLDNEIRPDAPMVVYPARARLVDETGQPLGTVKSQLSRLAELGWIERGRSSNMVLAWRWPRNFDASRPTAQPPWLTHQPADTPAGPADSSSAPADTPAAPRLTGQPLTSIDLPIEPSTNVVEARDLDALAEQLPPPPPPRAQARQLATGMPRAGFGSAGSPAEQDRRKRKKLVAQSERWRDIDARRKRELAETTGPAWSSDLTPAMLEAVEPENRAAWHQAAAAPNWVKAMGERKRALGLDDAGLGRIMAGWDAQTAELRRGVKSGQPSSDALWYAQHSAWARAKAGLDDSTPAGESMFAFHPPAELAVVGGGS